jgi:hypothetical protein
MANSMRARTVFVILLVLILLVAFGSALVAVGSQEIAALVFGCEVNLNSAVPCVIGGKDYGQALYDLGFAIWYSYLTIPAGVVLFVLWTIAATIVFLGWPPSAGARRRKLSFASC